VQPLAGHLADKIDIAKTVFGGLLLAALAIIAVTFTARIPLIVVVIIAGIGIGTVWTNSDALVSTLVNRGQLGASIGAAQSFKEFGDMVGPLLVGAPSRSGSVCGRDLSTAVALACLVLANFAAASPRGKIEVADL
jgi:MFS family permease